MQSSTRYRLGIDIGGTFTDIVLASSTGSLSTHKTLTPADDFGRGIAFGTLRALEAVRASPESVERIVYGTTIATNAILEHNGACTALVTTRGFRDVLEMTQVVVPPHPGVFSAYGLLCARIEHELVRTYLVRLVDTSPATLEERFAVMERELRDRMRVEGHDRCCLPRQADLRYAGQAPRIDRSARP